MRKPKIRDRQIEQIEEQETLKRRARCLAAFAFHREGVPRLACEEKHLRSRAVVIVCRDEGAARRRFGVVGTLYVRPE